MKRLFASILILVLSNASFGQIKYLNTLDNSYNMIELENDGLKFYKIDRKLNNIVLYNLNSTIYKIIKLKLPENNLLDEVKSISKYQFNSDDLIEIAFTSYRNTVNEQESGYSEMNPLFYTLNISNENGNQLLRVPGGSYYEIKNNKSEKVLIVLKKKETSSFPDMVTEIYSLDK